ncbi:hypothetical protein MMC14_008560 [Varicellaria rhodocarpa]|nr:hypothetical protein [Varicellaria rhodocarpa]
MPLFNFPREILEHILQYVGLRTSTSNLLVCKEWYIAALPVYFSGLDLTSLYISSWDLSRLPPARSPLGHLIQANVRQFSLRLIGHPSKETARRPWFTDKYGESDGDLEEEEEQKGATDWMMFGPTTIHNLPKNLPSWNWDIEMEHHLLAWRAQVNQQLEKFADILSGCTRLEELSVEISNEGREYLGPCWDYIYDRALVKLVSSFPTTLERLTFDICGSHILASHGGDAPPVHICPLLARRIRDLQHVRLRMRSICPDVINDSPDVIPDSPDVIPDSGAKYEKVSQLKSLVIRLSLPYLESSRMGSDSEYDARRCVATLKKHEKRKLYQDMVRSGMRATKNVTSLEMCRVSFRYPGKNEINLTAVDCFSKKHIFYPTEVFFYEDDGREWNSWESSDLMDEGSNGQDWKSGQLIVGGPFID